MTSGAPEEVRAGIFDPVIPEPVARLDPRKRVDQLSQATHVPYRLLGLVGDGQVGAALVIDPDGHQSILTQSGADPAELHRTAELMELAIGAGLPCPRYERVVPVPGATLVLQQRLPGAAPARVTAPLVRSMIELNGRMAGLLRDRPDVPTPSLHLLSSGPGFCLHESLEAYDSRSRRLLGWVRDVGRAHGDQVPGPDLVHLDFHPGNMLVDPSDTITGIVDWDGIGRGDRHLPLVTLLFDLTWRARLGVAGTLDAAIELVTAQLSTCDPVSARMFWAHMSLRLVDWSIRHHSGAEIDHFLDLALTRAD